MNSPVASNFIKTNIRLLVATLVAATAGACPCPAQQQPDPRSTWVLQITGPSKQLRTYFAKLDREMESRRLKIDWVSIPYRRTERVAVVMPEPRQFEAVAALATATAKGLHVSCVAIDGRDKAKSALLVKLGLGHFTHGRIAEAKEKRYRFKNVQITFSLDDQLNTR